MKDLPQSPRCAWLGCRNVGHFHLCAKHAAQYARTILAMPQNRDLVWALEFYFKLSERAEP